MAKEGMFGKKIPHVGEIVKIDGNKVLDSDGDEFTRSDIKLNQHFGGGLEIVDFSREKHRNRKPKMEK